MLKSYAIVLAWVACAAQAAGLFVADMEPPSSAGDVVVANDLVFGELRFTTPVGYFHRDAADGSTFPQNGSAYLGFASLMEPLVISNVNGSAFSVVQLDIAEYSESFFAPTVPLLGVRRDGSTVSFDILLDGVQDGSGPLADFQTVTFGDTLSDLQWLEVGSIGYSLDNVTVLYATIPEPTTVGFVLIAGLVVGLREHRPRRR